jgi:uncharacterized protein (TIGR01777 family)
VPLVRRQARQGEIAWDPAKGTLDPEDLRSIDAVIHLAGENVAQPWTAAARARIRDSRVQGTSLLAQAIARCSVPPKVLVSCSAIGLYGHEPAQVDESSPIGAGFLAEVVAAWEGAADPAREAGVRVVHPRVGIVQSLRGGALAKQLPAFQLGLGGPIGGGAQGVSWVGLDDLVDLLYLAMHDERLDGPFNAVSPNPVDQRTYARTLGQALGRPAVLPVPAFALRAVLGEMADEMLLGGAFVHPRRLEALGFTWRHPTLSQALASELGHPEVPHGT